MEETIVKKEKIFNVVFYNLEKKKEILQLIIITLLAFITPFVVPKLLTTLFGGESFLATNSQYVVGTIVNTMLILTGINISGNSKIIGIVTLPSISAMLSGFVFKTASIYTVYMIPAIWLGNFALIYLYRKFFVIKKLNYVFTSIIAIITKGIIIFLGFKLLTLITLIPGQGKVFEALQIAMGMNQLITASLGAIVSYGIIKIFLNNNKK